MFLVAPIPLPKKEGLVVCRCSKTAGRRAHGPTGHGQERKKICRAPRAAGTRLKSVWNGDFRYSFVTLDFFGLSMVDVFSG